MSKSILTAMIVLRLAAIGLIIFMFRQGFTALKVAMAPKAFEGMVYLVLGVMFFMLVLTQGDSK